MNNEETLDFFEGIIDMFSEEQKTYEFCNEYEEALNYIRSIIRNENKQIAMPIVINQEYLKSHKLVYSCRKCSGPVLIPEKYCSTCGQFLKWPEAGHTNDKEFLPNWYK